MKSTNVIQQDANGNKLLITNTTSTSRKVIITRKPSLSSNDAQNNSNAQNNNLHQLEFKTENGIKHDLKEENNNKIMKTMKNCNTDAMDTIVHNNNNNNVTSVNGKMCPNGGSVLMSGTQIGLNGFDGTNNDNNNNNNNGESHNGVSTTSIIPLNQKGIFLQQQQNGTHPTNGNMNVLIQGRF